MVSDPAHYALGLRLGLISTEEVQCWVNEQLTRDQEPTDTYLELAYTSPSNLPETAVLLNELAGEYDVYPVLRGLFAQMPEERLASPGFCAALSKHLEYLYAENDYKAPDDFANIGFFHDQYEMATTGVLGTEEEWHKDFRAFVRSVAQSR